MKGKEEKRENGWKKETLHSDFRKISLQPTLTIIGELSGGYLKNNTVYKETTFMARSPSRRPEHVVPAH